MSLEQFLFDPTPPLLSKPYVPVHRRRRCVVRKQSVKEKIQYEIDTWVAIRNGNLRVRSPPRINPYQPLAPTKTKTNIEIEERTPTNETKLLPNITRDTTTDPNPEDNCFSDSELEIDFNKDIQIETDQTNYKAVSKRLEPPAYQKILKFEDLNVSIPKFPGTILVESNEVPTKIVTTAPTTKSVLQKSIVTLCNNWLKNKDRTLSFADYVIEKKANDLNKFYSCLVHYSAQDRLISQFGLVTGFLCKIQPRNLELTNTHTLPPGHLYRTLPRLYDELAGNYWVHLLSSLSNDITMITQKINEPMKILKKKVQRIIQQQRHGKRYMKQIIKLMKDMRKKEKCIQLDSLMDFLMDYYYKYFYVIESKEVAQIKIQEAQNTALLKMNSNDGTFTIDINDVLLNFK